MTQQIEKIKLNRDQFNISQDLALLAMAWDALNKMDIADEDVIKIKSQIFSLEIKMYQNLILVEEP